MSEYCFFTPESELIAETTELKGKLETYADNNKKQLYILTKPLSKDDFKYNYSEAVVIFSMGWKPCFVNLGEDQEKFEEFVDDFIDDIGFLAEKYEYRKKLGRKRNWETLKFCTKLSDLEFTNLVLNNPVEKRVADLLTSLVIGSINDINTINLEPGNLLDKIKSKIVIFDTDQTDFVFKMGAGKRFVIQGLAGSGKTELLLHKIKEIYSNEESARIAFTCFNKILASDMRSRIPQFFNFMKVERQIEWDKKLFCFQSWGSYSQPCSGMYRYICHKYDIPFGTFASGSLNDLSKSAIEAIKSKYNNIIDDIEHIFDYTFIDESQDFGEHFIELCELVTAKKLFVAGDVFQNIFRTIDENVLRADLLLKRCYRTDPKNLMFSHSLGMGLFETPVLRWPKLHEWDACGYKYDEVDGRARVSRAPLSRFEDIPAEFKSTYLHTENKNKSIASNIMDIVMDIKNRYESVQQGDIAVLFVDKSNYIYNSIKELSNMIAEAFNWKVNISYESKTSDHSKFFISNLNNAKGLEFPFVICYSHQLRSSSSYRNGLYTMMARSFLESHLVLGSNSANDQIIPLLKSGLKCIRQNGFMDLRIPTDEEIANQNDMFSMNENLSIEDMVSEFCAENDCSPRLKAKLIQRMRSILESEEEVEDEYFYELLKLEYNRYKKL
ncbi:DEAD/DEAH box helicase [Shewanella algae]